MFLASTNLWCANVKTVIKSVRNCSCGGSHVGKHSPERRPIFAVGTIARSLLDSVMSDSEPEMGLGLRKRASDVRVKLASLVEEGM